MTLVFSAASLALCVFFFFYFRSFLKRRTAAGELLAEYRAEVFALIAEIDAATDRDSRLVEERIKTLKSLLEDTDRRISVYLRELDRSRAGEALYSNLGRGIRAALGTRAAPAEEAAPAKEQPAPAAKLEPPAVAEPAAAQTPSASKQQLRMQVAELAGQGLSAVEIASRLGLSLAEAELAINLLPENPG